jgi:hypothetical protein
LIRWSAHGLNDAANHAINRSFSLAARSDIVEVVSEEHHVQQDLLEQLQDDRGHHGHRAEGHQIAIPSGFFYLWKDKPMKPNATTTGINKLLKRDIRRQAESQ